MEEHDNQVKQDEAGSDIPDPIGEVKARLPQIKGFWMGIRAEGETEIDRGLRKVGIAQQNLDKWDYVENVLNQTVPETIWDTPSIREIGASLGGTVAVTADAISRVTKEQERLRSVQGDHNLFVMRALENLASTSGTACNTVSLLNTEFQVIVPAYVVDTRVVEPPTQMSRTQKSDILRELLSPYDERYTTMLDGCERALQAEQTDTPSQAAHSMRDLFQHIIVQLAPSEAVRQQPWYQPPEDGTNRVTRRSRVRYLLYGSGMGHDPTELAVLDDHARASKVALDLVIARAHDHRPILTKKSVEPAIDSAQSALIQILTIYQERCRR